ncbi:MAG: DinB family protein [Chloroflexota bacterium]|nr:DinB family protein [Chloroflexota bacterium]
MPTNPLPPTEIVNLIRENPGQISMVTSGLTPTHLRTAPEQSGAWSLIDILAHLRACADVWGNCISTILAEDHPTIRAINPHAWIERTDYRDLEFAPSFAAFTAQREALLATLDALTPEQWERDAAITGAGALLTRDVRFYAQWLARHERSHLKEMARVANVVQGCA